MTHRTRTLALACGLAAVFAFAPLAPPVRAALLLPFGTMVGDITSDDWALVKDSAEQLLKAPVAGKVVTWANPKNKHSGTSTVTRTYKRGDLPCAELTLVGDWGDKPQMVLGVCQVPDGSWKIAF